MSSVAHSQEQLGLVAVAQSGMGSTWVRGVIVMWGLMCTPLAGPGLGAVPGGAPHSSSSILAGIVGHSS